MSHPNPNPNPNPSRTSHRRNSFPAPDPSKSMDSSSIRTKPLPSSSYNPSTHLSKLGIGRRTSRARSPPPSHPHIVVSESDLQAHKKPLSKSAIFGKVKPFSQSCPQPDHSTVRVVREAKRVGLEKVDDDSPVVGVVVVAQKEKALVKKEAVSGGDLEVKKPMVRLGRSRSLCDPKVELGNFLLINGVKLVNADMPPFMQIHAVGCARKTCDSLEKFSSRSLALSLKKEFDGAYGPAWHCIVGTSFGSFVTHSVGGFLYFSMDQKLHILLFKTTVERAK